MSSPSLMASFGHSGSQAPQLMHSSVITVDITSFSPLVRSLRSEMGNYRAARRSSRSASGASAAAQQAPRDGIGPLVGSCDDHGHAEAHELTAGVLEAPGLLLHEHARDACGGLAARSVGEVGAARRDHVNVVPAAP